MSSEPRPEREREPRHGQEDEPRDRQEKEAPAAAPAGTSADPVGCADDGGAESASSRPSSPEPSSPEPASSETASSGAAPDSASGAPGPGPGTEQAPGAGSEPGPGSGSPSGREPGVAFDPGSDPAAGPVYADRCYRSPGALAGGVLLLLLALWLGGEALVNGDTHTRLTVVSGLVFAVPIVVAFTLRPAVYASARRMRVRNPFRTVTVPWGAVEALRSGYSSEVLAGGAKYQLWSIPVSLRARKRATRRTERAARAAARGETPAATAPARPTGLFGLGGIPDDGVGEQRAPSDQAIDELRGLAADHGGNPAAQGEVTVRWAYEIAGPALVGAVALGVLLGIR